MRDAVSAQECLEENLILRRVAKHCIEETEGYFVLTQHDDPAYVPGWVDAVCVEIRQTERALRAMLERNFPPAIGDNQPASNAQETTASSLNDVGAFVGSLQRWGPALRRLMVLLNACDMEAMELHTEMLHDVRVAALPEWQPLHQAMTVLDFEQAQNAVRHLLTARQAP